MREGGREKQTDRDRQTETGGQIYTNSIRKYVRTCIHTYIHACVHAYVHGGAYAHGRTETHDYGYR